MTSEAVIQTNTRLLAAYNGLECWRNNVGACEDATGRLIRYGLGNDSVQLNREIKSSDLIGITPVLITPAHIGQTLGVFTAFECKNSDWHYSASDKRAVAQLRFHEIVRKAGGFAGFVSDPQQIHSIIKRA